MQTASKAGVKTFGYLFTEPQPGGGPAGGTFSFFKLVHHKLIAVLPVSHGSEVVFVYGQPPQTPSSIKLSSIMIDYWVSFATSLDPNDGRGNPRTRVLESSPLIR
jgi:acetylcholinesterase